MSQHPTTSAVELQTLPRAPSEPVSLLSSSSAPYPPLHAQSTSSSTPPSTRSSIDDVSCSPLLLRTSAHRLSLYADMIKWLDALEIDDLSDAQEVILLFFNSSIEDCDELLFSWLGQWSGHSVGGETRRELRALRLKMAEEQRRELLDLLFHTLQVTDLYDKLRRADLTKYPYLGVEKEGDPPEQYKPWDAVKANWRYAKLYSKRLADIDKSNRGVRQQLSLWHDNLDRTFTEEGEHSTEDTVTLLCTAELLKLTHEAFHRLLLFRLDAIDDDFVVKRIAGEDGHVMSNFNDVYKSTIRGLKFELKKRRVEYKALLSAESQSGRNHKSSSTWEVLRYLMGLFIAGCITYVVWRVEQTTTLCKTCPVCTAAAGSMSSSLVSLTGEEL